MEQELKFVSKPEMEGYSQGKTVEENSSNNAREFIKNKISLDGHNLTEMRREVRDRFDLSLKDAADLTISILINLRTSRAEELLNTDNRDSVIEQLKKEWGGGKKLSRKKTEEIEKIITRAVDRATRIIKVMKKMETDNK